MDCKEDISDSDSGIMLHSGSDSPTSPIKDLTTHTRAMRLKHQALEERLELCLLELRKLCIREAELTGKMSPDYPLTPDEKPPHIRRRIGAAFKLDEGLIQQDGEESVLSSLEAELSLQRQICEAARRLSLEEHLSKPVRKSRQQQCKREERKMRALQETVFQHRIRHGCASPQMCHAKQRDLSISDDSSLSDAAAMDDESDFSPSLAPSSTESPPPPSLSPSPSPYPSVGSQSASVSVSSSTTSLDYQRCPIQNSPWRESSLDQPYQKNKMSPSACSSRSSSPTGTLVQAGVDLRLAELPPPMQLASMRSLALLPTLSSSAPSTPELPVRRQLSQSFRLPKSKPDLGKFSSDQGRGRVRVPRRRVGELAVTSPEYSPRRLVCQSSSEDSSSEHSVPSYAGSPCRDNSAKPGKAIPPPYGYHLSSQHKGNANPAEAHSYQSNGHHPAINNGQYPATNNGQHPVPNNCQLPATKNGQHLVTNNYHLPATNNCHLPATNNGHLPATNNGQHPVANNGHHPVTYNGQRLAINNGQHPAANNGQHPAANNGQHPAANNGQQPVANNGQHPAANNGQHPVTNNGQHPAAHNSQHPVTNNGQHLAANNGQHPAANNDQHPAANNDQHPAANNGQHPAANNGQHPAANNGQHLATNNSQHPAINNGQLPATRNGHLPVTKTSQHPATNNGHHLAANDEHHLAANSETNNINRNNQHHPGTNNEVQLQIKKINQQHLTSNRDAHVYKKNNSQQHTTPSILRAVPKEGSALEAEMDKLHVDPSSPARPVSQNNSSPKDIPSPKRVVKPPPPPYARLVRTPSLKEYPTHLTRRLLPREIVCEELKTWHQRNNSLRGPQPRPLQRQGSLRVKPSPNREPPAYQQAYTQKQAPQILILQRAPDGTPLQWFEEEDAEIVSQV
ncbi:innate immunity activator protein [Sardina pilchardus]|uniref:innate immunity activator protein n=1 Tax=Sardina pilchardus TaxID=27697 RepID=UPI002E1662B3